MKKRTVLFVCIWLLFLAGVGYGVNSLTSTTSRLMIAGENVVALNRTAVSAKISNPAKHPYLYFKFTEAQRARLSTLCKSSDGGCIQITVLPKHVNDDGREVPFIFGLLYKNDFKSAALLKDEIEKRPLVRGDLSKINKTGFSVSQSISKNGEVPQGFFVYCMAQCSVKNAQIKQAQIGWSRENEFPLFCFTDNGGTINGSFASVDLTQMYSVFSDENTASTILPKITIGLFESSQNGPWDEQVRVKLNIFGEDISIRRTAKQKDVIIQLSSLVNQTGTVELKENSAMVSSFIVSANQADLVPVAKNGGATVTPFVTDPGLIFGWPVQHWRNKEYELYSWAQFPQVLFFDTANYKIQDRFFTRLAYFVEKDGYKGTFVSDSFIETNHGYNAHDYRDKDLAEFFTAAAKTGFTLNEYELLLKNILLKNKIIIERAKNTYEPGSGAVISISQESPGYLRNTFIAHESWHGIYFTDADFRNTVEKIYLSFDSGSMEFIKTFWATQPGLHYDLNDDYLMKNEFMAYLMQQSLVRCKDYFLQVAGRGSVNQIEPELAAYVRGTEAKPFVDATAALNEYAYNKWGLAAGRVSLVNR